MAERDESQRRIFHIAYYESLMTTRTALLQRSGYAVLSALGNEQAFAAAPTLLPGVDAVLLGFSGPYRQRAAMVRWLKQQRPEVPVLVLQSRASETFQGADGVAVADDREAWLAALAACIERRYRE